MRNKRSHTKAERLVPLEAPGNRPRAIIAYDIAVLPWSSQGYRYVLVMVDLFSKQVEAWPMKEKEPSSLIGALENGWFNRHGIPNILLSDQEGAVDGQRIREMCKRLGIQKKRSSAYHQQGDGQAERSIQSFKTALSCIFEDRQIADTHWPKLLQEITFILNSLPNASTGHFYFCRF